MEIAKKSGLKISSTKICGGGAKSALWKKIIANVLGASVQTLCVEEGPAYGAAILAMVGAGEYSDVENAARTIVKCAEEILPTPALVEKYEQKYQIFKRLYPSLKNVFPEM